MYVRRYFHPILEENSDCIMKYLRPYLEAIVTIMKFVRPCLEDGSGFIVKCLISTLRSSD